MEFANFVEWAFMGLLSAAGGGICYLLWSLLNSIKDLNVQIAMIIERTARQEKAIDHCEDRLFEIEQKI